MSHCSESLRQRLVRKGTWRRTQAKQVISNQPTPTNDRISTFPRQFEGLRDQLFERAKVMPDFIETVFTLNRDGKPSDEDILQAVENRLFSIINDFPFWFGHTADADAKAHDLKRDHDIQHGFIKAAPLTENQLAAFARRKQERREREQRIAARASEAVVQAAS